jgi:predicted P-loop ATPase
VANAYSYARDSIGNRHPVSIFPDIPKTPEVQQTIDKQAKAAARKMAEDSVGIAWDGTTDTETGQMRLRSTTNNVRNFFRRPHWPPHYYNALYKLIRLNEFTGQIEFTRPAPWHKPGSYVASWRDIDTDQLITGFSEKAKWNPGDAVVLKGVHTYADDQSYHPLRDYFRALKWDGVERIDRMLYDFAGARDNAYTRAVSRCLMMGLIARPMDPGCKFDTMFILEGRQGIGKSRFCNILGGEFYADLHLDPHNEDCVLALRGAHLVELSEMVFIRKSDADAIKSFISRARRANA